MEPRSAGRRVRLVAVAMAVFGAGLRSEGLARTGLKRVDPAQVVPLDQVAPHLRESVVEVIRDAHLHRQGKSETFPCNPRIYMKLLNEPPVTLALWQDLASTPATLQQVSADRFQGTDGAGTAATWEFALRSPRLNVLMCDLDYTSPRGNARLNGRIVLIVRSGYFREVNGESWVQHDVEAFVKVDSRGWKAVAVTVKPLIEKLLEEQVQEAGLFVSLMGRLVESYPNWATGVIEKNPTISPESRASFGQVVAQTKRDGAFAGRPVMAANSGMTKIR